MFRKIISFLCLSFFLISVAHGAEYRKIEVFDMGQGKIVKKIENTRQIQHEVHLLINSIDGVYKGVRLDFKNGQIFKIPIEPTVYVENKWFSGLLSDAYLFQPAGEKPILLLMDEENKGHYLVFKKDLKDFLDTLPK